MHNIKSPRADDDGIESLIKAKGLNAPRVKPQDVQDNIDHVEIVKFISKSGQVLRWAVITTKNGYSVAGRPSCSASSENDDAEIGEHIAIENSTSEIWPLLAFRLRDRLCAEAHAAESPDPEPGSIL